MAWLVLTIVLGLVGIGALVVGMGATAQVIICTGNCPSFLPAGNGK